MIRTTSHMPRGRSRAALLLMLFALVVSAPVAPLARSALQRRVPGRDSDGATLLPNGWRIAPEGHHTQVGDLPLNMVLSPDGRYLIATNNGWAKPTLTVFDTTGQTVVSRAAVDNAWLGLVWSPDGKHLYSAGAADNAIYEFEWDNGKLKQSGHFALAAPQKSKGRSEER